MNWRLRCMKLAGPGLMGGATLTTWLRAVRENGVSRSPQALARVLLTAPLNTLAQVVGPLEQAFYGRRLARQPIPAPVFVLGHWRSGTTHLHNLFSLDRRFAYPQFMDVMNPHALFALGPVMRALFGAFIPRTRFGLDAIAFHPKVAFEEEFAVAVLTTLSPYMTWVFPESAARYDRYLTLRDVPADEVETWKRALRLILAKVSAKYGLPLVLKSPPHTARIRLLLEMFPDARFVHIHRNPLEVYRSTQHLHRTCFEYFSVQGPGPDQHERILSLYETMFDAYFADLPAIPSGHFAETSFAALERDPIGQMERIYAELNLPDFGEVRDDMRRYVDQLAVQFKKNEYPRLPEAIHDDVVRRWRRAFEAWNYDPGLRYLASA